MCLNNIRLKASGGYPKINGCNKNLADVNILKDLISNKYGVLTLCLQYNFQANVANRCVQAVGQILEETAILQYHHLNMLMRVICEYDIAPEYKTNNGRAFTSVGVNYSVNLKQMLSINIELQKGIIYQFEQAARFVKDKDLQALLIRLNADNKLVLTSFEYMLQHINTLLAQK